MNKTTALIASLMLLTSIAFCHETSSISPEGNDSNHLITGTWKAKKFISQWYHMSHQKDLAQQQEYIYTFNENGEFSLKVKQGRKDLNYCGNFTLDDKGLYLDYQGNGYEQYINEGDQSDVTYSLTFQGPNPILECYYGYGLLYKIELEKMNT